MSSELDFDQLDLDQLMATMVSKHCEWLNARSADGTPDPYIYWPADFDDATNQWGWRKLVAWTVIGGESLQLVVEIYDGDEGGPQTLTGFFEAEADSYWTNHDTGQTLPDDQVDWTRPERLHHDHSEIVGWNLRAMVQEFDTVHTLTMSEGQLVGLPELPGEGKDAGRIGGGEHEMGFVEGCEACERRKARMRAEGKDVG